ncbi:DNA-directed RNA polymerase [Paenibacillus sp. MER TA 81-3]|uniref:DNA-directed RNA polymerase n=1 Tax=Paenibacillus sp. MER TA 81-3 TaxID=2939573 RepID=UPI00203F8EF2|nr:DNA-directed RNA polymerase [Paenibacillus sp. MER TA 81-3]MCM3341679.1 DNA-directed RNA polymerase [Paenibacillus sp. MER TA 81-3]
MKVTSFISGAAIGILAGMYMADRRSLANLQSKLQLAGDMVQDVMGKAKDKVMDSTLTKKMSNMTTLMDSKAQHGVDGFSLDRIKALIDGDPEVRRKVDAILSENGLAPIPAALTSNKSSAAESASQNIAKAQVADRSKSASSTEQQSTH